jgi:hypothetical protein
MAEETKENSGNSPPLEEDSFELGDTIYLSGKNGAWEVSGKIYYLDESRIQILPTDKARNLETIEIIDGEFDPEAQIERLVLVSKRTNPAFVVQSNFHVGQVVDTIKDDGTLGPTYTITAIDSAKDTATFKDEGDDIRTIEFNFSGIPRDYNNEFVIMRSREAPIPILELEEVVRPEEVEEEKKGEDELEVLGTIDVEESREVVFVPKTEQIIEDPIQYSDMFQDLLNCLKVYQQKSPKYLAQTRQLVELMMTLRNDVVKYTKSGEPDGMKQNSYMSLGQLLENVSVPLAKPVIQANRVLNLDLAEDYYKRTGSVMDPPSQSSVPNVTLGFLEPTVKAAVEYYKTQIGKRKEQEAQEGMLPNWYVDWDGYFQKFFMAWYPKGEGRERAFLKDTDFFRSDIPELDGAGGFEEKIGGLKADSKKSKDKGMFAGEETLIGLSILRGTSGRTGKLNPKESARIIESPERGVISYQVLFPLQFLREFGSIRSSKLAMDVGTSMIKPLSIAKIIRDKKGITDIPSAGAILAVSSSSLGNISLEDWLENQPLESRGIGDLYTYLTSLGLSSVELTIDQFAALTSKVTLYIANLRDGIIKINAESQKQLSEITLTNKPFLSQERAKLFIDNLHADYLNEQIDLFRNRFPSYRENELALFSFLMSQKLIDYTLAILAKGETLAKETVRIRRNLYMEAVERRTIINRKKKLVGEIPQPNPCAHVNALAIVKKTKDESSYFKLLAKFVTKFGSERKDNWLQCTLCNRECLCYHDMLLLQEFLKPREKDVLHKELLLAFSEGQFHGRYCCKNCGQTISDVEYDNSLEYDDEGKPMSGRSVLVDKDAIQEEQLNLFLDAPVEKVEPFEFKTERENLIYKTALQLADKVGIAFTKQDLKKIIQRVDAELLRQPSVEEYAVTYKSAKAAGKTIPDYGTLYHRVLVCSTAAQLLICVQTNIPGYTIRYVIEGCKPGFSGYPFGDDSDKTGINYFACAVGGVMKNEAPWNLTGFQKGAKDKREALIGSYIGKLAGAAMNTMSVQEEVDRKKEHNEKIFGEGVEDGKLKELVHQGFLPPLLKSSDTVKAPIVEAAASESQKIQAWFLQANQQAFTTGVLDARSVYTTTTCCFTSIKEPGKFWKDQTGLPTLPEEATRSGSHGSSLNVHFKSPPLDTLSVVASEKDYYKIFLQICFTGPREGMKHEPGYDHVCPHCAFVFPKDPSIMNFETEGLAALQSQGIDVSKAAFEALVDKMYLTYTIEKSKKIKISTGEELLMKLADLNPPPFEGWKALLYNVKEELAAIPEEKKGDEFEVAKAYNALSNKAQEDYDEILKRMGSENTTTLQQIVEQTTSSAVQSIHDYVMIPYLRLANRFNMNSLYNLQNFDIPHQTEEDVLADLREHLKYNNEIITKGYVKGLTKAKVHYISQQFFALFPVLQKEVRTPLVPGGKVGVPYLLKAAIYGMIQSYINPNEVPPIEMVDFKPGDSLQDVSSRANLQILYQFLKRYREEGINFSSDQIREALAKRKESEKLRIINRLDKMSEEEKRVDLLNKKLGLGEWARGGTKGIAVLNQEQYDYENWELFEMGAKKRREREPDQSGFMAGGAEREDGYDAYDRSKDDE